MPWKEHSVMDERMKFVVRLLDGEKMSALCREYGISRKTGYKFWDRYRLSGAQAFADRSRRPYRYANQLPVQVEHMILRLKHEKPNWGAPKIRELILRKYPDIKPPAKSTVHAVLDRHGLVTRHRRCRNKATGTPLSTSRLPNDLWCADFKGEFMLGDRRYCYPLTITDQVSRYILACEALETTKMRFAFTVFERVFKERGLPRAIRTDNGVPFATARGLYNLSRLSVWWLRLGIGIERIKPGNPQQNGRHERMHLTLKKETTRPAGANFLQQQARFDEFVEEFNTERPHEALEMKCPGEIYTPSNRPYQGIIEPEYPFHDKTVMITNCGRLCFKKAKINVSLALAGQPVGIKEVGDDIWLVTFMDYDLGYFDPEGKRFEPIGNPFGLKVLPMYPV